LPNGKLYISTRVGYYKISLQSKADQQRLCVCSRDLFAHVTLTLARWPWYKNLT